MLDALLNLEREKQTAAAHERVLGEKRACVEAVHLESGSAQKIDGPDRLVKPCRGSLAMDFLAGS